MRFLDRFRRRESKSVTDSLELWKEIFGGREVWAGTEVTLNTALQVSTAIACGRVIAEGVAMLPWKVHQSSERKTVVKYDHPLHDRLAVTPSPLHTAMEFQETVGLHLAFCSAAYIWTPRVSGRIDAMYPLEPSWVTVKKPNWPGLPSFEIRFPDGRSTVLSSSDVWYIRGPSWNSYNGVPFMDVARQALGLSMALERGQAKLQSQGVNMPGYLAVEGNLSQEQHKKLEKWLEEHAGSENAGKRMVMDRAAKWVQTAMTNVDAQLLEQRRFAVEEVCRFMRVLPIMVGHADKTATYASAEQMFLAHAMYTLAPWARRLEQSANKHLLTPDERAAGLFTKLNEKALLRMSAKDQADVLCRYTAAGVMVRNEAREALDLNPIDGLDDPLTPMNTVAGDPPRVDDPPPGNTGDGNVV